MFEIFEHLLYKISEELSLFDLWFNGPVIIVSVI